MTKICFKIDKNVHIKNIFKIGQYWHSLLVELNFLINSPKPFKKQKQYSNNDFLSLYVMLIK